MNATHEKKWLDELAVELRLRDVPGSAIGDALASVKEFLADSGQSPDEAFGSPREYAADLNLPPISSATPLSAMVRFSAIGLVAFLIFTQATWPLAAGRDLHLAAAQLAWFAIPVAAVICLPLYLGFATRRPWALAAIAALCAAAGALSTIFAPDSAADAWVSVNPLIVVVVTGAIMIAAAIVTMRTAIANDDPIREPLGSPAVTQDAAVFGRLGGIVGAWLFPLFSVVLLAAAMLTR